MDIGKKRTLSDYLKMDGYKEATVVAAISVALMLADTHGLSSHYMGTNMKQRPITMFEQYEFATAEYEGRIKPIVRDVCGVAKTYKLKSRLVGPLFDAFRTVCEEDYKEFVNQLRGFSTQCQPVQKLAKALNENMMDEKKSLSVKVIAAYFIKTWNAYMQGDTIPYLRFRTGGANPEAFPKIFCPDAGNEEGDGND